MYSTTVTVACALAVCGNVNSAAAALARLSFQNLMDGAPNTKNTRSGVILSQNRKPRDQPRNIATNVEDGESKVKFDAYTGVIARCIVGIAYRRIALATVLLAFE